MSIFGKIFGDLSGDDEPTDQQGKEMLSFPLVADGSWPTEPECDEIPGSYGQFGFDPSNPIPVNGPFGETCYLNRLRSKSGVGLFYHRLGSVWSSISKHPLDQYELVAMDATEWVTLYFSPYYLRRSKKAPTGLHLAPWSSLNDVQRHLCKIDIFGSHALVQGFPHALADEAERNSILATISPGLGKAMARKITQFLEMGRGKWHRPDSGSTQTTTNTNQARREDALTATVKKLAIMAAEFPPLEIIQSLVAENGLPSDEYALRLRFSLSIAAEVLTIWVINQVASAKDAPQIIDLLHQAFFQAQKGNDQQITIGQCVVDSEIEYLRKMWDSGLTKHTRTSWWSLMDVAYRSRQSVYAEALQEAAADDERGKLAKNVGVTGYLAITVVHNVTDLGLDEVLATKETLAAGINGILSAYYQMLRETLASYRIG